MKWWAWWEYALDRAIRGGKCVAKVQIQAAGAWITTCGSEWGWCVMAGSRRSVGEEVVVVVGVCARLCEWRRHVLAGHAQKPAPCERLCGLASAGGVMQHVLVILSSIAGLYT